MNQEQSKLIDTLVETDAYQLYRVQNLETGETSLVKKYMMSKFEKSKLEFHYKINEEVRFMASLHGEGAFRPIEQEKFDEEHVVYFEDERGYPLNAIIRNKPVTLKEMLWIASSIIECVQKFHQQQYIVTEILPKNFYVTEDLQEAKLIHFQALRKLNNEEAESSAYPTSAVQYTSPELAGNTNVTIDQRSDIYSLGVILYELFVGQHPYVAISPQEYIYQHLAVEPAIPSTVSSKVPPIISNIIMSCLEKNPENRYQSIEGLLEDITKCKNIYMQENRLYEFPLSVQRTNKRKSLAYSLFDRKAEKKVVANALNQALEGKNQLVVVCGSTGIGKTEFVHSLLSRKEYKNRYFLHLTASVQTYQTSYSILLKGIEQFVDYLLLKSEQELDFWQHQILQAVSGNGQLLIQQVPKLEILIGTQPSVVELPLRETQTRMHILLSRFYQLIIEQNFNTVLFVDDIQWVDEASINLLLELVQDIQDESFVLICSYNEEEISIQHPFLRNINRLKSEEVSPVTIQLHPFTLHELTELFVSYTEREDEELRNFVKVIFEKTDGKPYELQFFMTELVEKKYFYYDEYHSIWRWNLEQIMDMKSPQVKASARLQTLYQLSEEEGILLGCAAFIGDQFSLEMIADISQEPLEEVRNWTVNMVYNRLIQPLLQVDGMFRFQHVDIWKAAKNFIAEEDRKQLLFLCGLYLLEKNGAEQVNSEVLMDYWNLCTELVVKQGYEKQLIFHNLQAGERHIQQSSFQSAQKYFDQAHQLLTEKSWVTDYPLTLNVKRRLAESEFLLTNFKRATELYEEIMAHITSFEERIEIMIQMIQVELSQGHYQIAVDIGIEALQDLGMELNINISNAALLLHYHKTSRRMNKIDAEHIRELPLMWDVKKKLAMKVLANIIDPLYVESKNGWFNVTLTMLDLTLDYGLADEAALGFVNYAVVLNWELKKFDEAYKWGKLACDLSEHSPLHYNRVYTTFLHCVDSWRLANPDFLIQYADYAMQSALQSGNVWHTTQGTLTILAFMLQFGHPLSDMYRRLQHIYPNLQHPEFEMHQKQAIVIGQIITKLTNRPSANDPYIHIDVEEPSFYRNVKGDFSNLMEEFIYMYVYITNYILGDYDKAANAIEKAIKVNGERVEKAQEQSSHHFYYALIFKELYPLQSAEMKKHLKRQMKKKIAVMKKMSNEVPINYLHKYYLMEAEYAKLNEQVKKAERFYELALQAAKDAGAIHDVGIIAECFAKYGLQIQNMFIARIYMNEAYEAYYYWGAHAKTEQLLKEYPHLLQPHGLKLSKMDMATIATFIQTLASETNLNELIKKIMPIMLENASATYGVLVLGHQHDAKIESFGSMDNLKVQSQPLEQETYLVPKELINYTYRIKEDVVLNNVQQNQLVASLDYFKHKSSVSVLCLPIIVRQNVIGVIYLENDLYSDLFTVDRISLLKILATQFSISIATSILISDLEKNNEQLEKEVRKHIHDEKE